MPDKVHTNNIVHREYILNVHDGTSEIAYVMQKIVCWQKMREVCLSRITCKGCPFSCAGVCDRQSTDEILKEAREVFKKYLINI